MWSLWITQPTQEGGTRLSYCAGTYDVAVVGAGHAGIEAALAAARLGMKTVLFTINLDAIGNMPCNPAIGGTGKGHLVRELDALGGEMGRAADACCIQYRMLNRGKGPAVHSLRAQADRRLYQQYMKHVLELQDNLDLKQAMVTELLVTNGIVTGLQTQLGAYYEAKAIILSTGTYLDSTTITGSCVISSGPDGMHPSIGLSDCLKAMGLPMRGSKPGRLHASTGGVWTSRKWSFNREMTCRNPFPSPPLEKLTTGLYATSPTPTKKPMRLSGPTWTKALCLTVPFKASVPATAPASRPNLSASG